MAKRELLLIAAFVILGVVVYQVTARPAGPGEHGLSASLMRLLDSARREIRGNRASAERTDTSTHAIDGSVTELRISEYVRAVHVAGEDRADVEASLHVVSNAYDDQEARDTAGQTVLRTERAASSLLMRVEYPRPGQQHATLHVKVPARLHVRVESRPDTMTIADVSGVEAPEARGDITVRRVAGRAVVSHQGGPATIDGVASLTFTGRRSRLTVQDVGGDASIEMEQGGSLTASRLAGRIDVRSRNAEVVIRDSGATRGPIRVDANGGSVALEGLTTESRVDSRDARVDVVMSRAAALAVYTNGGSASLTPPPGACTLDIAAIRGSITPRDLIAQLGLTFDGSPEEERATGAVGTGGPTITIRATRGNVVLRRPE